MEQVGEGVEGVVGVLGLVKACPPTISKSMRVISCKASATRLKFQTDAEAHGHVEPQRQSMACVEEGGVVRRLPHGPLSVGVQ